MRLGTMMCALARLSGCAASRSALQPLTPDLQRLSAGKSGCPPEGMTISDAQVGAARASWTATCQGKQYCCAAEDTFRAVSCVITMDELPARGEQGNRTDHTGAANGRGRVG